MESITLIFNLNNKPIEWNIVHNLSEHGLDITAALINWSARTRKYTQESFMKYVVSKDPYILKCMTLEQYNESISKTQ